MVQGADHGGSCNAAPIRINSAQCRGPLLARRCDSGLPLFPSLADAGPCVSRGALTLGLVHSRSPEGRCVKGGGMSALALSFGNVSCKGESRCGCRAGNRERQGAEARRSLKAPGKLRFLALVVGRGSFMPQRAVRVISLCLARSVALRICAFYRPVALYGFVSKALPALRRCDAFKLRGAILCLVAPGSSRCSGRRYARIIVLNLVAGAMNPRIISGARIWERQVPEDTCESRVAAYGGRLENGTVYAS